ncbi:hypothetical protein [Pseudomonas sp. BF-R-12]|uniref:hypothetical protein n=1 Tax=Pseudomonas sp. BF-R-12 TaxID=2832363 RepID=UPI001CBAFA45|nr:hypothetical protein [Pseudomonas sp. BF-R-12]
MATSYADSAQAREWDRRYDAWGRDKRPQPEEFHDYEAEALERTRALEDRALRLLVERKGLQRRIAEAMAQMETICPQTRGAA